MLGIDMQSDPSGMVEAVGDAVGGLPWVVPALLGAMIASGLVLLVVRLRNNSKGPGWSLRDND